MIAALAWSFSLSTNPDWNPLNLPISGVLVFADLPPFTSSPDLHGSEKPPRPLGFAAGGAGAIPNRSKREAMA